MRYIIFALLLILCGPLRADPLVAAGQPGAVLLMRHAIAPGGGDPAGFVLGDCSTQRNLSDKGRAQARAIGARLRAAGLSFDQVFSSEWCRSRETAELLDLGEVTALPPVNSFFDNREDGPRQTRETLDYLATLPPEARVVIVTHQVNITALTGVTPQSGETVVAQRDGAQLIVEGRLPPP